MRKGETSRRRILRRMHRERQDKTAQYKRRQENTDAHRDDREVHEITE